MRKHTKRQPDDVFREIEDWQRWLIAASLDKLRDMGLDSDALMREQAAAKALGAAIGDGLRAEYRARNTQP